MRVYFQTQQIEVQVGHLVVGDQNVGMDRGDRDEGLTLLQHSLDLGEVKGNVDLLVLPDEETVDGSLVDHKVELLIFEAHFPAVHLLPTQFRLFPVPLLHAL